MVVVVVAAVVVSRGSWAGGVRVAHFGVIVAVVEGTCMSDTLQG